MRDRGKLAAGDSRIGNYEDGIVDSRVAEGDYIRGRIWCRVWVSGLCVRVRVWSWGLPVDEGGGGHTPLKSKLVDEDDVVTLAHRQLGRVGGELHASHQIVLGPLHHR